MELIAALEAGFNGPNGEEFLAGMGILTLLITGILAWMTVLFLIRVVCRWRIFAKADERGWKALIPFYSDYTEYALTWDGKMYLLMLLLTIAGGLLSAYDPQGFMGLIGTLAGLVAAVMTLVQRHKLSVAFGHGIAFTFGLVFLEPIFLLILAFGKSAYVGLATNEITDIM